MAAIVTVGSLFGCIVGPAFCDKLGKFKGFLIVTTLIGAISMFVTWYTPVGFLLWTILVINGFFTAINGPIMQSMPVLLPRLVISMLAPLAGIVGTISCS